MRTRNAYPVLSGSAAPPTFALQSVESSPPAQVLSARSGSRGWSANGRETPHPVLSGSAAQPTATGTTRPASCSIRFARRARTDTASSRRRAHRRLAMRPRVAARSPMSGVSLRAAKGHRCVNRSVTAKRVQGPRRSIRIVRRELERITALFAPACSSPPSIAPRPRVAARSPMSGASFAAARVDECGRETLVRNLGSQDRAAPCPCPTRQAPPSHRRAHRHLPLRRARTLRRIRR